MGILVVLLAAAVAAIALVSRSPERVADRRACVYAPSVAQHKAFEGLVGAQVRCAVVFNDTAPTWQTWENPWFLHHADSNLNWAAWARDGDRRLVITQNLFPASENKADWRELGARGAYAEHAKTLATNLVKAGLGGATIRLGHEANGTWYPDSVGTTDADFSRWRAFWRDTVEAMRSVPGAHFTFDWTVNAAVRPIPLEKIYPGDDAVDVIGVDAYDSGVPAGVRNRWAVVYGRKLGLRDVERFARARGKPLSIPEWGIAPPSTASSGGDDPSYVAGIGRVVRSGVAYQSYFFAHEWAAQLHRSPDSLAELKRMLTASATSR